MSWLSELFFGQGVQKSGVVTAWILDRFHLVQFQQNVMKGETVLLHVFFQLAQKIRLYDQGKEGHKYFTLGCF